MDYSDPRIWSVVVALLALVLSQLPPIRELLKATKVNMTIPEQFQLYHYLGNPQINLFLDIHNLGGRKVDVSKVDCIIKDKDSEFTWRSPVRTYYSRQNITPGQQVQELFVGTISLKSGDQWCETVHCYQNWNRAEEERVNMIVTRIRGDINEKSTKRGLQQQTVGLIEAEESLVNEAKSFFHSKWKMGEGNYQLFISLISDSGKILCLHGFDFTLFSGYVQTLKSSLEEYKYGAGIYFPHMNIPPVWVRIVPITDHNVVMQTYQTLANV